MAYTTLTAPTTQTAARGDVAAPPASWEAWSRRWCRSISHDDTHLFVDEIYTVGERTLLISVCDSVLGSEPLAEDPGDVRCPRCRNSAAARQLQTDPAHFDEWRRGRERRELR